MSRVERFEVGVQDTTLVEEEDVLDDVELNRLALMAEHPDWYDPLFLRVNEPIFGGQS